MHRGLAARQPSGDAGRRAVEQRALCGTVSDGHGMGVPMRVPRELQRVFIESGHGDVERFGRHVFERAAVHGHTQVLAVKRELCWHSDDRKMGPVQQTRNFCHGRLPSRVAMTMRITTPRYNRRGASARDWLMPVIAARRR